MTAWSGVGSSVLGALRAVRHWWAWLTREEWWVERDKDGRFVIIYEHSHQGQVIYDGPFDSYDAALDHGLKKLGEPL